MTYFVLFLAWLGLSGAGLLGSRCQNAAIAIDKCACALILGVDDSTISTECGVALHSNGNKILQAIGRGLNSIKKGHTDGAIVSDSGRATKTLFDLAPYVQAINKGK